MTKTCIGAVALLFACGPNKKPPPDQPPIDGRDAAPVVTAPDAGPPPEDKDKIPKQVVADFEKAVLESQDAMLALFDFSAVGEFEILLHRYDALGRLDLDEEQMKEMLAEDATPYPPERERRNIGRFYDWLIVPAINKGSCVGMKPTYQYDRLLGDPFEPLPEEHQLYEPLRQKVNSYLEHGQGGVITIRCPGGERGLALVWTKKDNERGYDIITIYEDSPKPQL